MNCDQCQDLLPEYALDALEPREKQQVSAHLAVGCAECQQYLEDVRDSWAALADTLQPVPPLPHLKADLLTRLRGESKPSAVMPRRFFTPESDPVLVSPIERISKSRRRWQSALPYIAVTLCCFAVGFWFVGSSAVNSDLVDQYHSQLSQAERTFDAPRMRFAALHTPETPENRPQANGYLIWDSVAEELHVYAFGLSVPADASVHRLWFIADDDTWIPVGDLQVGPDGVCSAVIAVPALEKSASRTVVTTEPTGSTNAGHQTHGPIGLRGEFL